MPRAPHLTRGLRTVPPRLASIAGRLDLPVPPSITQRLQASNVSEWVRVAPPTVRAGVLTVGLTFGHRRDDLHFTVPDGFRTRPDLVAMAMMPVLARHGRIEFEFPISDQVREAIAARTGADVVATGVAEPRAPGSRTLLSFSGGMDSLAAWLLTPDSQRLSIDFGRWFARERRWFETLAPDVVCRTDFRSKGYAGADWLFMMSPAVLFADHLDLGWLGFGANLESTPTNFLPRGWEPRVKGSAWLGPIGSVGLLGYTPTRGMTEFCGSLVVAHHAPDLADASLRSLARRGSEKRFRKRLAYDSAVARRGGPPVDLEGREFPTRKIELWRSFPTDVATLGFMALYPPSFIERFVARPDPELVAAARAIRPDFLFRCHPGRIDELPPHLRPTVLRRMADAGVELYRDDDWHDYEQFCSILGHHYRLPA